MKISVDGVQLFELSDTQKKVIADEISTAIIDADLKRRLQWILMHKYDMCFKNLKNEWEPKLAARGLKSIPTNRDEFAQLVFSQTDYKDRMARDSSVK
jgi:hypothetical protein